MTIIVCAYLNVNLPLDTFRWPKREIFDALVFSLFLYENVNKLIDTSNKTITNNFVLNAKK